MEDVGDPQSHLSNQLLHLLEREPTMAAGPYSIDPTTYLDDLLSQAPGLDETDAPGLHQRRSCPPKQTRSAVLITPPPARPVPTSATVTVTATSTPGLAP